MNGLGGSRAPVVMVAWRVCVLVCVVCVAAGSEKQIRPKQATALYKRLCRSLSRSRYKHSPDPRGKTPAEIFAGGVCIRY